MISLCAVQAGDLGAMSVVPGKATLVGTVRTFSAEVQAQVERRLDELCSAVAPGFGATATVKLRAHLSGHHQHARAEAMFAGDVAAVAGRRATTSSATWSPAWAPRTSPSCCRRSPAPTCASARAPRAAAFLHNSRYDFNDEILPLGAALHAGLIEQGMPLAARPDANARTKLASSAT